MIGRRARIIGRVQGVFFRVWARGEAEKLGVRGWVRNRRDGSVELEAYGPDEAVEALIDRCRRGPPDARVENIEVEEIGDAASPGGFRTLPTL